ncbi:MAG: hypothetical protein EU518_00860 [Promethearchaeota archaeon]|nr:MAG: hypothetical protein EU518_00860 [Candidatus Lokiarchaeota archaeon]
MAKKDKLEKIDIKKKRKRMMELRREKLDLDKKKEAKGKQKDIDIRLEKETKLYWVRAITGAVCALVGRLIGFVGWLLLIWMLFFWFVFPFFASFIIFQFKYDKEEWTWKNIIMPGIGMYFFLFMIVSTILHTLLVMIDYPLTITIFGLI